MPKRSKEARIADELKRISVFYEDAEEDRRAVIGPLLQNAAFMRVTLEDLQELINSEGVVDQYKNGEHQYGYKQSAALQSYNALIKNYTSVTKSLTQYLPYKKTAPTSSPWAPREKTEEEREAEWEERERQVREEHALAVEYQKEQREAYAAGARSFPSFPNWKTKKKAEQSNMEEAAADMRAVYGDV